MPQTQQTLSGNSSSICEKFSGEILIMSAHNLEICSWDEILQTKTADQQLLLCFGSEDLKPYCKTILSNPIVTSFITLTLRVALVYATTQPHYHQKFITQYGINEFQYLFVFVTFIMTSEYCHFLSLFNHIMQPEERLILKLCPK